MSQEQNKKKELQPKVKSLFRKALNEAQNQVDKAQGVYDNMIKQADKTEGAKFLDAVVDLALAKAKIETLQNAYKQEGGGDFPSWD